MSDMQDQAAQDSLLKTAASESDSQASSAAQSLSHNSADQSMQPLLRSPCRTLLSNLRGERPNPQQHYKVGIYIRYFNQTKHVDYLLSRVLRLCAGTWEGDENSFSANILNGITRLVYTFGDQLNDEVFKERVGALSIKQLVRMSKERCPGSMGYAEAMLLEYNGKKKNISQRLSMNKLHMQRTAGLCSLLSDVDTSPEAATAEGVSE